MDLDELKEKWAEYDRKLETNIQLNKAVLSTIHLGRAQSALQWLIRGLALESVIDFIAIVVLGSFLYDHIRSAPFAVPAILLDLYAITILGLLVRQMITIQQINYNRPIAAIQKQVEGLRIQHIRCIQWTLLLAPLAWALLLIVAFKGLFGIDVYRLFGLPYILANLMFGVVMIPVAIWFARRFQERASGSPFLQNVMRDIAGHSLNRATDFLTTLAEFETEKSS